MTTSPKKDVSLTSELLVIEDVLTAARVLADALVTGQSATPYDEAQLPAAISATLDLVGCRLRDLGRVLQGDLDPARLHAHFNVAGVDETAHVLVAWPDGTKRKS